MAFLRFAQPIKAYRVKPFEDIAVFPVLRRSAVFYHKPLDLLEARDDPLFSGGAHVGLIGRSVYAQFAQQLQVFIRDPFRHCRLPSLCAGGRQPLLPSVFPTGPPR